MNLHSVEGEVFCPGYRHHRLPSHNLGRRIVSDVTVRQSWENGTVALFGDVTIEGETYKAACQPHNLHWMILPLGHWEGEYRTWRDITAAYWN